MKIKGILASTCAAMALFATAEASAQGYTGNVGEAWPRWYVGVTGGINFMNEADVSGPLNGDLDADTGWGVGGVVGYMPAFEGGLNGLRLEAEVYYRNNGIDRATVAGVTAPGNGDLESTSYMANVYYDFRGMQMVVPYLGAGIGAADYEMPRTNGFGNIDDSDTVFAWQLMAGLNFEPKALPYTIFSVGYRYHDVTDPEFTNGAGQTIELDPQSHNLEAGVKFRF